ncbi:Protein of unknown function [Pseudarcicella hirudinis]|uniref:N-acetylmuramidase domain-containing protein n=1 Tax=Pseudarcicella hirudinis TaxID=1079859 RepID=A0A1I5RPV8_9BACT|nr:N-acetylmuramidase family protein [Pseudarcicella hirudinis]SFP60533.1 Protein of unknown function [Pseudarcicella hirudinis]
MAITEAQFQQVANKSGIEVATIKAVNEVEAAGNGFFQDGRPKILFEGHIFWKQLKKKGINPESVQAGNEEVLYPVRDQKKYLKGVKEYDRLNKAIAIDEEAALSSASWGAFQIMGFNFKPAGFSNVKAFVDAMKKDEFEQLKAFSNFITALNLNVNLANHDWKGFAFSYNGKEYLKNKYDSKLKAAYEKFSH